MEATWRLMRNQAPINIITEGLAETEKALARNPKSDARLEKAALEILKSFCEPSGSSQTSATARETNLAVLRGGLGTRAVLRLEWPRFIEWAERLRRYR